MENIVIFLILFLILSISEPPRNEKELDNINNRFYVKNMETTNKTISL